MAAVAQEIKSMARNHKTLSHRSLITHRCPDEANFQ
jgi:hypothetical protein